MSSDGGIRMFDFLNKDAFVVATCVFCGGAILFNLFLMIVIVMSPSLRSSYKHILIFTLCLTDLYEAVASSSLIAELYALEKWIHDARYLQVLDFPQYYVLTAFRMMLMVSICGVSLIGLFTKNTRFLTMMSISMIVASFLYSLVMVLPVSETKGYDLQANCFFERMQSVSVAAFFPQAVLLVVLLVDLGIVSCCCTRAFDDVTIGEGRRFPLDVILASIVMLVYSTTFKIVGSFFSTCSGGDECERMYYARGITMQWENIRPCILPLVWIIGQEVRKEVSRLCCSKKSEQPTIQTDHIPGGGPVYNMPPIDSKRL